MKSKPLITIVTVTYNAEEYLERTIKSVIEQDYKNIEYIIIDGGSSDGTIDIIKKYEKFISSWISEKDEGIFYAMNKGIDLSTGEWINFLNAGDTYIDKTIITSLFNQKNEDTDIVLSHTQITNEKINTSSIFYADINKIYKTTPCFHQSQFVKRSILNKYKYITDYRIVCDYDLMINCFQQNMKFQVIDLVTVNFLFGGFSAENDAEAMIEGIMVLKKYAINFDEISNSNWASGLVVKNKKCVSNRLFSNQFNHLNGELKYLGDQYNKIALYGYGEIGKYIAEVLKKNVHMICDKSFSESTAHSIFCNPKELQTQEFDLVIICVFGAEKEVKDYLLTQLDIDDSLIYQFKL